MFPCRRIGSRADCSRRRRLVFESLENRDLMAIDAYIGIAGMKGESQDKGPDVNGDGQSDKLYFNYAPLVDLDEDGDLDVLVAGDPDGDGVANDSVIADLDGDDESDLVLPPGPAAVLVDFQRYGQPLPRLVASDYDGDGRADVIFALDVNGDGLADVLTSIGNA